MLVWQELVPMLGMYIFAYSDVWKWRVSLVPRIERILRLYNFFRNKTKNLNENLLYFQVCVCGVPLPAGQVMHHDCREIVETVVLNDLGSEHVIEPLSTRLRNCFSSIAGVAYWLYAPPL